jgi:hypothetical protein
MSPSVEHMLGHGSERTASLTATELVHPEDLSQVIDPA